jgi:circadian clock protein KaiB
LKTNQTSRATRAFEKAMATKPEGKYFFRLYVAGATTRSRQALRRVYQLCEAELKDNYELEVIDVYQQPELARDNQIVATPTLVKEVPLPTRRFIGNLLNITHLFVDLDLIPEGKIAV